MTKLIAIVISLFFMSCTATNCKFLKLDQKNVKYTIKEIEKIEAVHLLEDYNVQISQEDRDNLCGGTIIKSNEEATYVITAAHCVMDSDKLPMEYGFIEVGKDKYRVEIENLNRANDLALLKTTDITPILNFAPIANNDPNVGDDIWIVGFGARIDDIISRGMVSKTGVTGHYGTPAYILQVTAWYGNSGGGVFNSNLELVGVIIEFGPQGGGRGGWFYASELNNILELLIY